jgi:hypothetical protein
MICLQYCHAATNGAVPLGCVSDFEAIPGRGLGCIYRNDKSPTGEIRHARIFVGNRIWMEENKVSVPPKVEASMAKYVPGFVRYSSMPLQLFGSTHMTVHNAYRLHLVPHALCGQLQSSALLSAGARTRARRRC